MSYTQTNFAVGRNNPTLGQWGAVAQVAVPLIRGLFGKRGPTEAQRISAARTLASQQLSNVRNLPSIIEKVEGYVSHGSIYWACQALAGSESTGGRACIIAPCMVAKMIGWGDPLFIACNPLQKAPATFTEMENRLMPFFQDMLPKLKAKLAAQQKPTTVTQPTPTIQPVSPTVTPAQPTQQPTIITVPSAEPSAEPQIVQAGMGNNPMLWVALGLGAVFFIAQMGK